MTTTRSGCSSSTTTRWSGWACAFLDATPGIVLIGEAADGRTALHRLDELAACRALPDVVVMDLVMPDPDGVTATRMIKKAHPGVEVVVVTSFARRSAFTGPWRRAAGYVLKDARVDEMARDPGATVKLGPPPGSRRSGPHIAGGCTSTRPSPAC